LLNRFIPACDTWLVIDNSQEPHKFVAGGFSKSVTQIYEVETWQNIKDQTHE